MLSEQAEPWSDSVMYLDDDVRDPLVVLRHVILRRGRTRGGGGGPKGGVLQSVEHSRDDCGNWSRLTI